MAKVDAVAELAAKFLHTLEGLRQSGGDYPPTVERLAALADPQAAPEQVLKALAKKPFAAKWVVASKKDLHSPIAPVEDAERLAGSPLLVEFALGRLCSADKPLHTPAKVILKVDKSLRPTFQAALARQIADNSLPEAAGVVMVRGNPQLYLRRFPPPPPPPPKKKPAEELSEELVQTLARLCDTADYPTTLERLIEQTGRSVPAAVRKQALGREPFRSRAVLGASVQPGVLVALAEDAERLAASPLLLQHALTAARSADNQAVSVADLKKKVHKALQGSFGDAVNRQVAERALPDGVGVLFSKKKPLLFLLADLHAGPPTAPPPKTPPPPTVPRPTPSPPTMDFARLFDEAFARLDREHGSHNHVSLVALRRAVPVERGAFDAGLQQLRRAGLYGLSAAEGRHGLSAEERDAGIPEDGSLLLFVSRREG
jgi:hypothetical protein